MGIGQAPLIPLYRLQADPEARFQRFGRNDSQLLGKPLLTLEKPANLAKPTPPTEALERRRSPFQVSATPHSKALEPDYGPSPLRRSPGAALGGNLDLKA